MHGGFGPSGPHGRLHLGDEHTLTADAVEGRLGVLVALGADDQGLHLEAGVGLAQEIGHELGLEEGQRRAAGGQAQHSHDGDYPMVGTATGRKGYAALRPGARPGAYPQSP